MVTKSNIVPSDPDTLDAKLADFLPRQKGFPQKNIPISDIIYYADKGLSQADIARLLNCNVSNIRNRLQAIDYSPNSARTFRNAKDKVFEHLQEKITSSLTAKEIEKMPGRDKVVAIGILQDKIDQIRGQGAIKVDKALTIRVSIGQQGTAEIDIDVTGMVHNPPVIDVTPDNPLICNDKE